MKKTRILLLGALVVLAVLAFTACDTCEHEAVVDAAVAATCTESGLTEGSYCSLCNEVLVAQETVPATGHTEQTISAVAATCIKTGLTEGKKCTTCGEVLVAQESTPITGHIEQVVPAVAATCTKDGSGRSKRCSICYQVLEKGDTVPATGHKWTSATCTKAKTCSSCGATDGKALGHTTGLGKCTRCKSVITTSASIADQICDVYDDGFEYLNDTLNYIKKALNSTYYTGTSSAVTSFALASGRFERAAELCGDKPEFADAKKAFKKLDKLIDDTFSGNVTIYGDYRDLNTLSAIMDTMEALEPYLYDVIEEMAEWAQYT